MSLGFKNEVGNMCGSIVSASVSIFEAVNLELLPTPTNSHYLFNIRDLSLIFQGILMASPRVISVPEDMINLWVH